MTNVSDVLDWLDRKTQTSEDTTAMDLWQLFSELPHDLDLASAKFYLKKEYQRNDTGVDDRVQIFTFDPEPADDEGCWDSSGYDSDDDYDDDYWDDDDDEDASWRVDYH